MREINRIPKRWINQPNGVPQLNADGDLEGPIILRDIKDPATGGGPEDVPAANEIVVVHNNLAVGKNGTTWTPYAPLEVAMDAVAFQNRTINGISFTAEYVGEPVPVKVFVSTTAMSPYNVVWPDRTVTTHNSEYEGTWSGETVCSLPIEIVPVNDTIAYVELNGYYVNDIKCSHLPQLQYLHIYKSKMRVLDLRGCSGMKTLLLRDSSPGAPKGDVRTILLDPAIVWWHVALDLDDYGDVDISGWRWDADYGASNLLRGRTICGHLNLAGWMSESYVFEVDQTRISEVTMPASVKGFVINNSELRKINGGEDLQMTAGEYSSLDLSGNKLSAEELDAFFARLPAQTEPGCNLSVMGNPGSDTCNPSIAQDKGFTVSVT